MKSENVRRANDLYARLRAFNALIATIDLGKTMPPLSVCVRLGGPIDIPVEPDDMRQILVGLSNRYNAELTGFGCEPLLPPPEPQPAAALSASQSTED